MMKKIFNYKLIIYLVILTLVLSCFPFCNFANAYSSISGNLKVEFAGDPPLFSEENWKPSDQVSKKVTITNLSSTNSQNLGIVAQEKVIKPANGSVDLAQVLGMVIKYNNSVLYEDILANLFGQGEVYLTTLYPLQSIDLDVVMNMDEGVGNEYQGLKTEFDFIIGFAEISAPVVPPIGLPPLAPAVLGMVPIGRVLGEGVGILGPEEVPEEPGEGEVKAEKEEKPEEVGAEEEEEVLCFWWWTLLLILLVLLLVYYYYIRGRYVSLWFIPPFIIAGLIYLLHEYLHRFYTPVAICDWFWLGTLIVLGGTTAYYYFYLRKSKEERKLEEEDWF